MPAQPLHARARRLRAGAPRTLWARRAALFSATLILTAAAFMAPYDLFIGEGLTWLELAGLLLFAPLFVGISYWFCGAFTGFVLLASGRGDFITAPPSAPASRDARTALLAVIRNEDVAAVYARLRAMDGALAARGATQSVDVFVLSDTSDEAIAAKETIYAAQASASASSAFYYRRRVQNTGRKAGNIADWVRRFGGGYDYMIVLDADSLMSADVILNLTALMEERPGVGVIQTIPSAIRGESLFARYLQFGMRLYGRIAAAGLAWWSGPEALYWGHNAIVRTRAFAEAAALPRLQGAPPFGGDILSHDVVEGWLMRRAGWGVMMAPLLEGSYEEPPPTLMDNAARDARWCQGNLQHLGMLTARGLHWVSRLQLVMAVMIYVAAPLWLAFLAVGVALRLEQGLPDPGAPWFEGGAERLLELHWSIVLTVVMLFGPKCLGALLILLNRDERCAFGGARKLVAGLVAETLMSALLAPTLMLYACRAVARTLSGRDQGWAAQRRSADGAAWPEAWRLNGWQSAGGLVLLAIAAPYSDLVIWMAPIIAGLILSAPLAALSASPQLGALARSFGLFVTPEELATPALISSATQASVTRGRALPQGSLA